MKDKAYYEDVNIKNELKLRDMIQKLPKFCMDFFIGIDADKSSRTKIAYAYDLQTFFEYMKSANPSLKKYDMPRLGEQVTTQTWAYGMKGFYGYRNFSMNSSIQFIVTAT